MALGWAPRASAQTTTGTGLPTGDAGVPTLKCPPGLCLDTTSVVRSAENHVNNGDAATQWDIAYKDCAGGDVFTFPGSFTPTATAGGNPVAIEVWISGTGNNSNPSNSDCHLYTDRYGSTVVGSTVGGVCTKVASVGLANMSFTVTLSDQQIIDALLPAVSPDRGSCNDTVSTITSARPVNINFLLIRSSVGTNQDVDPSDDLTWNLTQIKLLGPSPPTGLCASTMDSSLKIDYTISADTDTQGYYVYCDDGTRVADAGAIPASCTTLPTMTTTTTGTGGAGGVAGSAGAAGTGGIAPPTTSGITSGTGGGATTTATGTGGSGGSTTTVYPSVVAAGTGGAACSMAAATCPGHLLLQPGYGHADLCFSQYGYGTAQGTEIIASGLTNGATYGCFVAAYDSLGNVGALSAPACQTPYPVLDFFSLYRADGGTAGGGFCGIALGKSGQVMSALSATGLGALALALRRRTRRARVKPSTPGSPGFGRAGRPSGPKAPRANG